MVEPLSVTRLVSVAAGATVKFLGESRRRVGFTVFPGASVCSIAPAGIVPTAANGWSVLAGAAPFKLEGGPDSCCEMGWQLFSAGTQGILVTEYFRRED